jgi:hypothetical protein
MWLRIGSFNVLTDKEGMVPSFDAFDAGAEKRE